MHFFSSLTRIASWKSNGKSEEKIENIPKWDCNFTPTFVDYHVLSDINFNGHSLINNNLSITEKVINLYISYILSPWLRNLNTDFTLKNCLFGSVNPDPKKYKYSGYGIGFNSRSEFLFAEGSMGKNVIIFEPDMGSSMHINNKKKDISILGEGPAEALDDTKLPAEAKYAINFYGNKKKDFTKFTL